MPSDDRHAERILHGSTYERIRYRSAMTGRWSPTRKVRWCGYLLLSGSLLFPILASLPAPVTEGYVGTDPTSAPLGLALSVLLFALLVSTAGVGLVVVSTRAARGEELTEGEAWRLVGIEDACTCLGFVTGSIGLLVTVAVAAVGLLGLDAVDRLLAAGVNPYFTVGVPVTSATASLVAAGAAIALFALASLVESSG
jgi:hypothetical protein